MLHSALDAINTSRDGPEAAAQRWWGALLQVEDDKRLGLCADIEKYFTARAAAQGTPSAASPSAAEILADVFAAALYAIHNHLAVPFAWHSAQVSRLGDRQSTAAAAASPEAARMLAMMCEEYLLRTEETARSRFRCLLEQTGMGVPLLSLVLDAYGTAVAAILAHSADGSAATALDRCLQRLKMAADACTLVDGEAHYLTIAHPIYLHVARAGGRTQEALQFFREPVRCVNPILTGIGFADYVTYYGEAALLLASLGNYVAAFYALAPVHSLSPIWGLSDRLHGRSIGNEAAELYFASLNAATVHPSSTSLASAAPSATTTTATTSPPVPSVQSYPWYRAKAVSTSHTCHIADYRAVTGEDEVVEWRLILAPSPAETLRDQQTRAWALRLSLMLLTLAFGGGNPREVCRTDVPSMHFEQRELNWTGVSSVAVDGHVCFPSLLFYHLSQTTRVSLPTLLAATVKIFSAEMQMYYDLLRAVAQRDLVRTRALLDAPSAANVFASDLTVPLAEALGASYLARHIVLDVARLYSQVPMRALLQRILQDAHHVDEEAHARKLLSLLARLCASGELACCDVGSANAGNTRVAVESVVAADNFAQRHFAIDSTSISFKVPSASELIQLCARIASPGSFSPNAHDSGSSSTLLLQMLTQLQSLQDVVEAEHRAVEALR